MDIEYNTVTDAFTVGSFTCNVKSSLASIDATGFHSDIPLFNTGNFTITLYKSFQV